MAIYDNYVLTPDEEEIEIPNINKLVTSKEMLRDVVRTEAGFVQISTYNGNKKIISLQTTITSYVDVFILENLFDTCAGFTFTFKFDYINGSIEAFVESFSHEKSLQKPGYYVISMKIREA